MDGFVKKPDLLSFYIASKIPISEPTRQELLEIDGISYRLRREIELLERLDRIRCKICQVLLSLSCVCVNTQSYGCMLSPVLNAQTCSSMGYVFANFHSIVFVFFFRL